MLIYQFIIVICITLSESNLFIGLLRRVFASGLGDKRIIPGRVIPKTLKIVLDAFLLSTQHYKVGIKVKVE